MKTVGRFSYDEVTGKMSGPEEYMNTRLGGRLEKIYAGQDTVFNMGLMQGNDAITAALVSIQTDYAGWKGTKDFCAMIGRKG